MEQTAFERLDLLSGAASSLRKEDEGVSLSERVEQVIHRIIVSRNFFAFNQNRIKYLYGEVSAQAIGHPIVARGDWTGERAKVERQCGPEDDGVQVAGVIGEIDALGN